MNKTAVATHSGFSIYLFLGAYVSFGLFASDISLIYLIVMIGIVLFRILTNPGFAMPRLAVVLFVMGIYLLLIEFAAGTIELRILKFSASCFLLSAIMSLLNGRIKGVLHANTLTVIAVIWIAAVLVTLIKPESLNFLFYRVGWTESRGATGFSPEPAYLGMSSAYLCAVALHAGKVTPGTKDRRKLYFASLLFLFSCMLSLSMVGMVYLILLSFIELGFIVTAAAVVILVGCALLFVPESMRIVILINTMLQNGLLEIFKDESTRMRVNNFFIPLRALESDGLPLGTFGNQITYNSLLTEKVTSLSSGITILLVRYGVFGFLLAAVVGAVIVKVYAFGIRGERLGNVFGGVGLLLLTLFVGPLSLPYFIIYVMLRYSIKQGLVSNDENRKEL